MTTTRYVKPIETSQNTGIHHRKLNQRISTVYDIENSAPHQVCLDLYPFSHTDAFSGNNARNQGRENKCNGPSIHLSIYFRLSEANCRGSRLGMMLSPPFLTPPGVPEALPDHARYIIPPAGPPSNGLHLDGWTQNSTKGRHPNQLNCPFTPSPYCIHLAR